MYRLFATLSASIVTCLLLAFAASPALAAPGDLDTTFGSGGIAAPPAGTGNTYSNGGMSLQSDGKILVTGAAQASPGPWKLEVERFNANGSVDSGFGTDGVATPDLSALGTTNGTRVAQLSDGKILVAGFYSVGGYYRVLLVKFNTNGSLDSTFDGPSVGNLCAGDGIVCVNWSQPTYYDRPWAIKPLPGGGFFVAGSAAFTGTLSNFAVAKFTATGAYDATFNTTGVKVFLPSGMLTGYALAIDTDANGNVVLVGDATEGGVNGYGFVRLDASGGLDNSFAGDGAVTYSARSTDESGFLNTAKLLPDGKILAFGTVQDPVLGSAKNAAGLVRVAHDGTLDPSFGSGGRVVYNTEDHLTYAAGVEADSVGRILLASGHSLGSTSAIDATRLLPNGAFDASFGNGGTKSVATGPASTSTVLSAAIQPDGKFVVHGDGYGTGDAAVLLRFLTASDPVPPVVLPPTATITSPSKKLLKASKVKALSGTAGPAGSVKSVEVALQHVDTGSLKKKQRCYFLKSKKAAFKSVRATKGKCSKPYYRTAAGTNSWKYRITRTLPKGSYVLTVRVTLLDGRSSLTTKKFKLK